MCLGAATVAAAFIIATALDVIGILPNCDEEDPVPPVLSSPGGGVKTGPGENWAAFPPGGGRGSGVPFAEFRFESSPSL